MDALAVRKELCMDTTGGERLGRFWAAAVGARFAADGAAGDVVADEPSGSITRCIAPEAKTAKHRVHWDVYGDPAALEAAGATVLRRPDQEIRWTVMADPEGNELCVFAP